MNWTGGRLRRQSHNRPDSTLKIQKQHFARARLKQRESHNNTRIAATRGSPFTFSVDAAAPPCSIEQQATPPNEPINRPFEFFEARRDSQESVSVRPGFTNTRPKDAERDPRMPYIDFLKQYLLGKKDWVGLSPTRPLKMKFTSIEEKEQIGKRRKLSKAEEERSTAMARSAPNIFRIASKSANAQLNHRANDVLDWGDMNIQISAPQKMGQVYERFRSPIRPRSASSDCMLEESEEEYGTNSLYAEKSRPVELDMQEEPPQDRFARPPGRSRRGTSVTLPETEVELESSPIPVLHRFTLDDQVLAERIANSQREGQSSGVCGSDYRDFYLNRNVSDHQDASDEPETLLSFSARSKATEDRCTDITGSHETNPTESDVLPRTQKISRKLPPSQPHVHSDTPTPTIRDMRDFSGTDCRPINKPIPIYDDIKSPTMLFGQEVHSSIPPAQTDPETTTFRFAPSTIRKRNSFVSNIHSYQRPSPPALFNNAPKPESKTEKAKAVFETPRSASTAFRFPSHWTPHRNIQRLGFITDNTNFPPSALTTPLPQRTPVVDILSRADQYGRSTAGAMRHSPGNLYANLNNSIGHEGQQIMAPVFNTPFRRQ